MTDLLARPGALLRQAAPATILGAVALLVAGALVVLTAPNWLLILSAGLAVLLLGAQARLGFLGAGLLVLVALPFSRGADVQLLTVADVPVRAQDAVVAVALLAAAVQIASRGPRSALFRLRQMPGPLLLAYLALGVVALVIGIESGNAARDIGRDVRWWALYPAGLLAMIGGTTRSQVLRGLLIGATFVSVLVIVAAILPQFPGGLKDQALTYDRGVMRMQFANTAFVGIAAAYATWSAVRGGRRYSLWLVVLVMAVALSLTRTTIVVVAVAVALTAALTIFWQTRSRTPSRARIARAGAMVLIGLSVGGVLGIAVDFAGTPTLANGPLGSIMDRFTFQDYGVAAGENGRFKSYIEALDEISRSPLLGRGLGSLVKVDYAYSVARSSTIGFLPAVDNAFLTAWLKVGLVGLIPFVGLMLWPLWGALRRPGVRHLRVWFVPAWLGILVICMTQALGASGYSIFGFSLLFVFTALPSKPPGR